MNSLQEFVDMLQLSYEGEYINDTYIIRVNSSNEFSDIYNQISLNKKLEPFGDSTATSDISRFKFTDGYFEIDLQADFNRDRYFIKIESR